MASDRFSNSKHDWRGKRSNGVLIAGKGRTSGRWGFGSNDGNSVLRTCDFFNIAIISWALFWRICSHAERSGGVGVYLSELIKSISLDTLRENCGIIRKQASTDGGVLWEIMRVNVVQKYGKIGQIPAGPHRGKILC
ncbi:hypothetical protein TNCV_2980681 [Trichonephila clavipes]|nr:hypothetical protein TNCV_2980681 [Trichonephila clavipes]